MTGPKKKWLRLTPLATFLFVFAGHALFLRHQTALPPDGWADVGVGTDSLWGFESYLEQDDQYMGFSYALGAGFAVWAFLSYLRARQAALAVGAAGSLTLVGALMGAGCFMVGCCGSPMLGVYAGIFGAKALGVGKPLMAAISALSVFGGYWYLSRRMAKNGGLDNDCKCNNGKMHSH